MVKAIKAMQQIAEIVSFNWYHNISVENLDHGFQYLFEFSFADEAARDRYLKHPAHVELVENSFLPLVADARDSIFVFDYQA